MVSDPKPGQRVTYISHNGLERGIVKSTSGPEHCFIVYHCDDRWDRYEEYTAARTRNCDIVDGWIQDGNNGQ